MEWDSMTTLWSPTKINNCSGTWIILFAGWGSYSYGFFHSKYRGRIAAINDNEGHTLYWFVFLISFKSVMYCWQKYPKKHLLEITFPYALLKLLYFKLKLFDTLIYAMSFFFPFCWFFLRFSISLVCSDPGL